MQIQELGHLVLYVHNLERSISFYLDILGWRMLFGGDDGVRRIPAAAFSSPSNRTHHELLLIEVGEGAQEIPAGRRVGMYHFGLKIGDHDDDLRQALVALKANDVTILGASDHTITHSLYIADPDGNEVELYVDVPGVDWINDPSLSLAGTKPLVL